jgi:hypothetical protein
MIICITDKTGLVHIVDFGSAGKYRTICSKRIFKTDCVNLFAADAAIKSGCHICNSSYDEMYIDDLNITPKTVRSSLIEYLGEVFEWTKEGILSPQYKYGDIIDRNSRMISKLKRKYLTRTSNHAPPTERR